MAPAEKSCPLCIRLFGPFEAQLHGDPLPPLRSRKVQWLLALLLLRHGREVERDWLAGLLWPAHPTPRGLALLRRELNDLRRALGPEAARLHAPTPHSLTLDLTGAVVDLVAFEAALAREDAAGRAAAVALYRGPLLEGCTEEWAFQERCQREQAYLVALESLAADALAAGDAVGAERHLRRAVAVEPLRESVQRALMQVLASGGNYAGALQVYREVRERLHRELNAPPDPETQALFQQLREEARDKADGATGRAGERASSDRPLTSSPGRPAALPGGTLTFLFTDVEGSTRLLEQYPQAMRAALARHDQLLRQAIEQHGGTVFKVVGDQFCAAFPAATEAVAAALAAQRALQTEPWPLPSPCRGGDGGGVAPLRVRMALHTGEAEAQEEDYTGLPLHRVAHLVAAGHGGQILLSPTTGELVGEALPEGVCLRDLGERRLKEQVRPEKIFQVVAADLPADFPKLKALDLRPGNLPAPLSALIGRQRELDTVCELLRRETGTREAGGRLLTLTGPGGTGKTRLALQLAADLLDDFAGGVFFVDLAPIRDPELVAATIAQTLGVRESGGQPLLSRLQEYLREKPLLLLLDNFEQVLSAAPRVVELLQVAPGLKVLVTSREALHVSGEQQFPVPPLSVPAGEQLPVAVLAQYGAVALFVQRASQAQPEFALTEANAAVVAEICRRLDGLPLALELAAARVKLFAPAALLSRLQNRLQLLVGGARDVPSRQRTLRETIAWSYDLLTEGEQRLFRRLSVFVGGCTLEAAEAVCSDFGFRVPSGRLDFGLGADPSQIQNPKSEIQNADLLEGVASLVDKSLLRQAAEPAGEPRLGMLETIREYGVEALGASGEEPLLRRRHCDWFLALAEQANRGFFGPEPRVWLERLETENDNLRAALEWSGQHEPEAALRLVGALWRPLWMVRGYLAEGRERVGAALRAAEGRPELHRSRARAAALLGASALVFKQGGPAAICRALTEESLAISRELGDREQVAGRLTHLGILAYALGDYSAARSLSEESAALYRELGRKPNSSSLGTLGDLAYIEGDYEAARSRYEESLALSREAGSTWLTSGAIYSLGRVAYAEGNSTTARSLFAESMTIYREFGDKEGFAGCLASFACLAAQGREWERAARLWGAEAALREATGVARRPGSPEEWERELGATRAALGEEAFAAAWAAGQALPLEEAIEYALESRTLPEDAS